MTRARLAYALSVAFGGACLMLTTGACHEHHHDHHGHDSHHHHHKTLFVADESAVTDVEATAPGEPAPAFQDVTVHYENGAHDALFDVGTGK